MGIFPRNHCPASLLESSPEWYEMAHMPFPARLSGARLPMISALGRQKRGVESLRPALYSEFAASIGCTVRLFNKANQPRATVAPSSVWDGQEEGGSPQWV